MEDEGYEPVPCSNIEPHSEHIWGHDDKEYECLGVRKD